MPVSSLRGGYRGPRAPPAFREPIFCCRDVRSVRGAGAMRQPAPSGRGYRVGMTGWLPCSPRNLEWILSALALRANDTCRTI